jgi:hypothetical protein
MDENAILRLLRGQAGVVSRAQVLEHGGTDNDIERLVRRRVWATVHRGVYVDHTGPLTWDQRAWAAVLHYAPAVLDGRSAMRAHRMRVRPAIAPDSEPIEVAIDRGRRVGKVPGVRVRRADDLHTISQRAARPPRVKVEHAVLIAAAAAPREDAAVALLAHACQEGRTTARRLATALTQSPRLKHRRLLGAILDDVTSGAHSVLERRYLVHVERAHALPRGSRQVREAGLVYRDVGYGPEKVIVELDGRLAHGPSDQRWADLDRDLAAAASGDLTVRVAWGQVLEPCRLAVAVGRLLSSRGWAGRPIACGPSCIVADGGDLPAPGADDSPPSLT